jgi:hypothetical protein
MLVTASFAFGQSTASYRAIIGSKEYEGRILAEDDAAVAMLRTNGRITILPRARMTSFEKVSDRFWPLGAMETRQSLENEFGNGYQVSSTGHFVVVHPPGEFVTCAQPFETLYEQIRRFFETKGVTLGQPEFQMVAIVLNTRPEFEAFLQSYTDFPANAQGYYSPMSNRIVTYRPDGHSLEFFTESTLIHEATHQVAFNTGVHSRSAQNPRWLTEGTAVFFEARGVHSGHKYNGIEERLNLPLRDYLVKCLKDGTFRGKVRELVENDELFETDPEMAYAMSWGLTFYLFEGRSEQFTSYLREIGSLGDFEVYTSRDRVRDFEQAFGSDFNALELRMLRYLATF